MKRVGIALLGLVALLVTACGGAATAPSPAAAGPTSSSGGSAATGGVPFKFSFDFALNGFEAPFYAALARGYYTRQGLDVQIVKGVSPADSIQWVATGKVDMSFDPWEEVIAADSKGADIKVVAGLQEQTPFGLLYRADHPIRQPSDLYTAAIGVPPGSAAQISLEQFIAATHLTAARIKISNTSPAAELGLLGQGKLTAIAVGGYAYIPLAAQTGIKTGYYPFSRFDIGATGENIVAPQSLLTQHPQWVKGFLLATDEGFAFARAHPNQAVADEVAAEPALKASTTVAQLKLGLQTLGSPNTAGKPWGWQSSRDWLRIIAQTRQYQGVRKTQAPQAYYTNAFLPTTAVRAP